jgi:hypothetical protein
MCGMVLAPGDEVTLEPPADSAWDFNQIWFDVQNAGDGIAVVLWC